MIKGFFKKNASTILSAFATGGIVAIVITTSKAAIKADIQIKADSRRNHDGDPYAATAKEKIQSSWKYYILPAGVASGTVMCIIGANVLNKKQQASLVSAYALLSKNSKRYKEAVKDILGEDAHEKVVESIAKSECDPPLLETQGVYGPGKTLEVSTDQAEVVRTFYDLYSGRYFESTMSSVLQAEYHLNRNFSMLGLAALNEWYSFLGLEGLDGGDELYWFCDFADGIQWIDFAHYLTTLDDNDMEVVVIEMAYDPGPEE